MNAYFIKMNQAERNNILDQHKKVYDGYTTDYGQQINQQPLYVQDLANDKLGLTVNNKGEVKYYTNTNINESVFDNINLISENLDFYITPDSDFEIKDEIITNDYNYGLQSYSNNRINEVDYSNDDIMEYDIEDDIMEYQMEEDTEFDIDEIEDEIFEDMAEPLEEQVNKVLDMFKRFKKYGNN